MEAPPTPVSLKPETYGRFLCTTFDLYFQELSRGERVSVRWLDNVAALLAGYPPGGHCGVSGACAAQIVLEADGSAYPCDFYVHQRYRLGSAVTDSFQDMLSCETARRFQECSRPLPADCAACPAYPLCRNGCRRYRLPYLGDAPGKNVLSGAYRSFFDYAGERLVRAGPGDAGRKITMTELRPLRRADAAAWGRLYAGAFAAPPLERGMRPGANGGIYRPVYAAGRPCSPMDFSWTSRPAALAIGEYVPMSRRRI